MTVATAPQPILRGIDAYEGQGTIDWLAVRRSGVSFAFVKGTQGTYYQDSKFARNWQRMYWRGIIRGVYHFLDARYDGAQQADYLHAFVRHNGGFNKGDMVAIDLEETFDLTPSEVIVQALQFIGRVYETLSLPVIVYTDPNFWETVLGKPPDQLFYDCPLWLSEQGVRFPSSALGWPVVSFWQFSTGARQIGVTPLCDLDLFYGDEEQLRKVAGF